MYPAWRYVTRLCPEHGREDLACECASSALNEGMMANPNVDKFKVWPTQLDRGQFADVKPYGSRASVEKKHPQSVESILDAMNDGQGSSKRTVLP